MTPAAPLTPATPQAGPQSPARRARAGLNPSKASGLMATAAHNAFPSAGSGAARSADLPALFAVTAPHNCAAPRTTTNASTPASPTFSQPASPDSWTCCVGDSGGEPTAPTSSLASTAGVPA